MEKINIAELLKDCPRGMELYSPLCGKCVFDRLNMGTIICKKQNTQEITFTSEGYYMIPVLDGCECMIFPSKDQRDWSKFHGPFKDGDVLAYDSTVGTTIFIHRNKNGEHAYKTSFYVGLNGRDKLLVYDKYCLIALNGDCDTRLATKEEKEKLFQAIKDNGYSWNAETKTLEKLPTQKSKISWHTGIPKNLGYYIVTHSDGRVSADIWLESTQRWDRCIESKIVAWCPVDEIEPYSEQKNN